MGTRIIEPGTISLTIGPMFSGKTTKIIEEAEDYIGKKKTVMVVKYAGDNRYSDNELCTHNDKRFPAIPVSSLCELDQTLFEKSEVIVLDEGQFFPDLVDFCISAAVNGKNVIIAALNGDYLARPFKQVSDLMPHCQNISLLRANCKCGKNATYSSRITQENELEVIGGSDKYQAKCFDCYYHN